MPVGPYGALLDAVRGVRWLARRPVGGGNPGSHLARTRGMAPEFAEYRPYRQGDDPRRLDWKLLARSDRAFIRLAPDHATLPTSFVVDASASMAFPSLAEGKWRSARELTVALAAIAHAGGDPVGATIVSGEGIRQLAPRTRRGVIAEIAATLDAVTPSGVAALAPVLSTVAARCVLIFDALGDLDASRAALGRHLARGGEAHVVYLVAREELTPRSGTHLAVDPEDVELRRPLAPTVLEEYQSRFAEFRATAAAAFRREGIAWHEVRDDEVIETVARRIVAPVGLIQARR